LASPALDRVILSHWSLS